MITEFLDTGSEESLDFDRSVNSTDRDVIRQICKHFDLIFKVDGEGTEKFMRIGKPKYDKNEIGEINYKIIINKLLTKFQKNSKCQICQNSQINRLIENCIHTFCSDCLSGRDSCPECGEFMSSVIEIDVGDNIQNSKRIRV